MPLVYNVVTIAELTEAVATEAQVHWNKAIAILQENNIIPLEDSLRILPVDAEEYKSPVKEALIKLCDGVEIYLVE